ncbi:MAG: hypothetical protein ACXVII_37610, partial [Solirubrobacteraceae bacterium]
MAAYVACFARCTCLVTASDVDVASRPTSSVTGALTEGTTKVPVAGEKATVSCEVPAANELWQMKVALWAEAWRILFAQPEITRPPSENVSDPDGWAFADPDVTVATNVACWLVIGLFGRTASDVATVVVTDEVRAEAAGVPMPAAFDADSSAT